MLCHYCLPVPVHIALLRGVNVGGRWVKMDALRGLLSELGCTDVRSLLQSGNLVFNGGRRTGASLERWLEDGASSRLGLNTEFHVRTAAEWRALIAANPFPNEAKADPARLVAMCFKEPPKPAALAALRSAIIGPERLKAVGRELYIVYPLGMGTSRLTTTLIDSKLGSRGTARNWNTVRKLGELLS
jgi:uncharacterized protein (DUF1697 family)